MAGGAAVERLALATVQPVVEKLLHQCMGRIARPGRVALRREQVAGGKAQERITHTRLLADRLNGLAAGGVAIQNRHGGHHRTLGGVEQVVDQRQQMALDILSGGQLRNQAGGIVGALQRLDGEGEKLTVALRFGVELV